MLLAPALQATLSKLHLNRNTARAIIFGPSSHGSLGLPALHTSMRISQLRLLLDHLCLQDKMAMLLLIDISYMQILIGSSTLFFNLLEKQYGIYAEPGWLTSLWKFLNQVEI